jgi:hypothetical protein
VVWAKQMQRANMFMECHCRNSRRRLLVPGQDRRGLYYSTPGTVSLLN